MTRSAIQDRWFEQAASDKQRVVLADAGDERVADAAQRLDTDDVVGHVEVDESAEPHLEGVGVLIDVATPGEQPALDPLDRVRTAGTDAVGPAGLHDNVPQLITLSGRLAGRRRSR